MEIADRFEFKFVLDQFQGENFLESFRAHLKPDTQGSPTGVYPVVSLYYDTPDLDCYWDTWRRLPSRRKMRVRVYGSKDGTIPAAAVVEIKSKLDGRSTKQRFQTDLQNALQIGSGLQSETSIPEEARQVVDQIRQMVCCEHFQPRCVVRYQRSAFTMSSLPNDPTPLEEPLRITFDEAIQYRFESLKPEPDDSCFSHFLLPHGFGILEIKGSGGVPFSLSTFLGKRSIQATSFSKYCHAMDCFPGIRTLMS